MKLLKLESRIVINDEDLETCKKEIKEILDKYNVSDKTLLKMRVTQNIGNITKCGRYKAGYVFKMSDLDYVYILILTATNTQVYCIILNEKELSKIESRKFDEIYFSNRFTLLYDKERRGLISQADTHDVWIEGKDIKDCKLIDDKFEFIKEVDKETISTVLLKMKEIDSRKIKKEFIIEGPIMTNTKKTYATFKDKEGGN